MTRTLGLFFMVFAVACSNRGVPPMTPLPPAIEVDTVTAETRPMPRTLPVTGTLIANRRSDVAANAAGLVVKTFIERGDHVDKGAPLVQLDTRDAVLSNADARANLRNAKTQWEFAKAACARNDLLRKKNAMSQEEWERSNSQCALSLGTVEAIQARTQLAAKTLTDATIRAPFSGMIGERYVNAGEYVQPPTKVATLVELDPLRLQFTVGEADIGLVRAGQKVIFAVEAYPGERFTATIKHIDPTVRSATRDLVVEATVGNPDHRLRSGMFATAQVPLPDEPTVSVPLTAVRHDPAGSRLFAVVSGVVEERIVQVGIEKDGYVAVLDGIKAGERAVRNLGENVKDGVAVK